MFSNCRLSLHMSKPGTFKEPVGSLVQSLRTFAVCAAERARELSPLGRCEEDPGIWRMKNMKNIMQLVKYRVQYCNW